MKKFINYLGRNKAGLAWVLLVVVSLAGLLLYKLGTLTSGLSSGEIAAAIMPVGWHGIYHQPLYLPLKIVRSVVFALVPAHGQMLTRLPNVCFGALAIMALVWLLRLWHSARIAILGGLLFATGAWTLHISRLASFDVMYLWATPTLLLINSLLQRNSRQRLVWYGSLATWGLLLYVPGLVWLIVLNAYLQRVALRSAWQHFNSLYQRGLYALLGLVWLPLLIIDLLRPHELITWLGLPSHWPVLTTIAKHLLAVPVHLFIRGPEYPASWLGKAPLLDIFTLAMCLLGVYFYIQHHRAGRSRLLGWWLLVGGILVGLGGPVGLSLLVPLLYIAAAAGLAYLLHDWMHTFPSNPLARSLGLGLVTLAVALSCLYNLRAYFVAWPHNQPTAVVFKYHR